jgi:hypothetical protein
MKIKVKTSAIVYSIVACRRCGSKKNLWFGFSVIPDRYPPVITGNFLDCVKPGGWG